MTDRVPEILTLYPEPGHAIEPLDAIAAEARPAPTNRPWVMTNMIASLDGATAVDGLSGALGGPADLRVFLALRARCDLIIVGAATAISETYRPPVPSPDVRRRRSERGQPERPRIAVVTRRLSISSDHPLFSDPSYRPIIVTTESAPIEERHRLNDVADVLVSGHETVDLGAALQLLADHGVALLEGGPSLNAQFVSADLIDEWNLSTAPLLVGGASKRAATGDESEIPRRFDLDRVWSGDGLLFGRWLRAERPDH